MINIQWCMEKTILGAIYVCIVFIDVCTSEKYCPYLDTFNKIRHRWCKTACCGSIHQSHCCVERTLGGIVFGCIGGIVLLISVVLVTTICCRRYNRCTCLVLTNGAAYDRVEPSTERPFVGIQPQYGSLSTDSTQQPDVNITVTPPSPMNQSMIQSNRVVSRPTPTFTTFNAATETTPNQSSTAVTSPQE